MKIRKNVALIATTLVVLLSASATHAQGPQTIKIDPTKKSVDTGVQLAPGDIVEVVDVKGSVWVSGPGGGGNGVTYQGNENTKPSTSYYEYAKATPHSLVAFIGDKTNHYQVRRNIFTEAATSGNLFFAFNDGSAHYNDNKGAFDVTYRVIKKAKVCSPASGERLPISWLNKTGIPVRVNWINFDCKEETSNRLIQPNGVFGGETAVGHLFRVRDEKGADLGVITVEKTSSNVNIVK